MRSAPTLKIWMTPFASVAMLEKLALLKIARCRAPALSSVSSACVREVTSPARSETPILVPAALSSLAILAMVRTSRPALCVPAHGGNLRNGRACHEPQETAMNSILRNALAASTVAIATQAAAQVTFYEHPKFQGQSFTTEQSVGNLERYGFNNPTSSAVVRGETWQVCYGA